MESTDCDIMFIDETKLYESTDKPFIKGYDIIQEVRKQVNNDPRDKPGGCIAAIIKDDLAKLRSEKIKINQNEDIIAFSISTKEKPIFFILGYAPQNNSTEEATKFFKDLDEYIKELKERGDVYIIGDMNAQMPMINKEKNIVQEDNRSGKILKDIINVRNLETCYEKFPENIYWTRMGRTNLIKHQTSVIDYVIESKDNITKMEDFEVDEDDTYTIRGGIHANGKKSDHNTIQFKIKNSSHDCTNIPIKIRINKRKYNPEELNREMSTIRYNTNLNEQENYERWLNKAQDFLNTYTKEIWVNTKKRTKKII